MSDTVVTHEVPLRWVDLDAQGHVNNANIVDYLQEARVAFLLGGPNAHLLGDGVIVVDHQIEYLRPVEFTPDRLRVDLRVGHVGAARFTIAYLVSQFGEPVARARTNLCVYDFAAGHPVRLTPSERAAFSAVSTEVEPLRSLGAWQVGEAAHHHELFVRWSDLDSYGHVNNTRFFDYVAEARVHLNTDALPNAIRTSLHGEVEHVWMVVRQDMHYLTQMAHRLEPYRVRTAVAKLGRTSLTLVAQIEDPLDGTLLARALTVLVHADASGRPLPVPEEMRSVAERWPAVHTGRGAH